MALGFGATLLTTSLFLNTTLFADTTPNKGETLEASRLESWAKFHKVVEMVEQYGVDELTIEEIMTKSMEGLLSNIDAHSAYLTKGHFKNLKIQTDGEFGGLGITVGIRDGALTVIAPIEGTPADKAGLKSGDIILKINETSSLNMTIDEAVAIMRGKPKTSITLTIVRKDEPKPITVDIVRDIIQIDSVYAKTVEDSILYLRVTNFDKKVTDALKEHMNKHLPKRKGIILDLRNNPGGLLDQAVGVVNLFVKEGVIVSQKGRKGDKTKEFSATEHGTFNNVPIVVLVNGGSASASEIVSGALQDHKRAIIVGEKTFGKGSVQVILPVTKDDAVKLTIARYYLPSGRTIQAIGVTPDITIHPGTIQATNEEKIDIKEADLKKHLESELEKVNGDHDEPKIKKKDKKDDKTIITAEKLRNDLQLKSAVDILKALILTQKGDK
jgi:carboxyl-terminal processing protease